MLYRLAISFALAAALTVQGQTPGGALPAPAPVHQIGYRHWPEQFMQWVGTELPYSMIELYVDPKAGASPLFDVVLTQRSTGKRIHYSDQQSMVEFNKRLGFESYLTSMQFDRPANPGADATYILRFTDRTGESVIWRFVQGSETSDRGSGLSPAGIQPPVLMYRDRSAVAGQGTALQIGKVVSAADVWKEISMPPYFIPYHGALTENLEIAVFGDSGGAWTTLQAPASLAVGAQWKLKAADGHTCVLKVTALQGDLATLTEEDERLAGRTATLEGRLANGVWSITKVRFAPAAKSSSKGITITFAPGVGASAEQSKFEVFSGGKTRIANGTVLVDAKQDRTAWQFRVPEWLRVKPAVAQNAGPR